MNYASECPIPYLTQSLPWVSEPHYAHFQPHNFYHAVVFCPSPLTYHESLAGVPTISLPQSALDSQSIKSPLFSTKEESQKCNQKVLKKSNTAQSLEDQNNDESQYDQNLSEQERSPRRSEDRAFKKYKQNAQRNIMTNIGNQLITFLGNRKRSQTVYLRANQDATKEQIANFYEFIHKLRKRKRSPVYINRDKLLELWYPKHNKAVNSKNYRILRQMSLIFIQEFLPLYMINSARIKKETKMFHISAVRKFLHLLRYHRCQ